MADVPALQVAGAASPLTEYELRQVCAIAAWKGERPGPARALAHRAGRSLGKLSSKLVPERPVKAALSALNQAASRIARDDSVLKDPVLQEAGVSSLADIAAQPLEFSDRLADRVIADAGGIALGMGAATGAGGPLSAAAGIPALLFGALRAIHRVSHAYGYDFEPERERRLMLGVLSLSTAATPEQRLQAMEGYRLQIESAFFNQAVEETAIKALQRAVLGVELGAMVPDFNVACGAYLSRQFVTRAGVAAKRVFQELWLRDRGKVVWIAPV